MDTAKIRELSCRDKWLYAILIGAATVCALGGIFLYLIYGRTLSTRLVPGAMWTAAQGNDLWAVGSSFMMVWVMVALMTALEKGHSIRNITPRKAVLTALGWLLGFVMFSFCFLGGTHLYADGTVRSISVFGEEIASYTPEQIERVFLEIRTSKGGTELRLTMRTPENNLLIFEYSDLMEGDRSRVELLREILERYPDEKISSDGAWNLERLCQQFPCSEEEQTYLEELFDVR